MITSLPDTRSLHWDANQYSSVPSIWLISPLSALSRQSGGSLLPVFAARPSSTTHFSSCLLSDSGLSQLSVLITQ